MQRSITPEALDICARAAHEANRAYCLAMGDTSQKPWDEATDWQRLSCIHGAAAVVCEHVEPEELHRRWMAEKERNGWKYGPVKDSDKLEHPCMVPYAELPAAQRSKDTLFRCVVLAMAWALTDRGVTVISGAAPRLPPLPPLPVVSAGWDGQPEQMARHLRAQNPPEVLQVALAESVKLQSHYAGLLNQYDEGQRRQFANEDEWIGRLRELGRLGI